MNGIDQVALKTDEGVVFAVRRVEADFISPAKFDEDLVVTTDVVKVSGAQAELLQQVLRGDDVLFSAKVSIVSLMESGRPARLPAEVRRQLAALSG